MFIYDVDLKAIESTFYTHFHNYGKRVATKPAECNMNEHENGMSKLSINLNALFAFCMNTFPAKILNKQESVFGTRHFITNSACSNSLPHWEGLVYG